MSETEPLVVQLFNVDAGALWNEHFDRVFSILDIHHSMRDLTSHPRVIDGDIVIMLVSTDECLISTKSEKTRSKVVDHLKQ